MEKDTQQPMIDNKDIQATGGLLLVLKDSKGLYLSKRSEKIAKAFFLITQHIPETMLIKQKIRNSALELIAKTTGLVSGKGDIQLLAKDAVLEVMTLTSMSDIATTDRLISETNYRIVTEQTEAFVAEIYDYASQRHERVQAIPSSLFDLSMDLSDMASETKSLFSEQSQVSVQKDISYVPAQPTHPSTQQPSYAAAPKRENREIARTAKPAVKPVAVAKPVASQPADQSEGNKNERQQLIIQTIRSRGESSIKDLTEIIKGCSEKTVQRELIALVSAGILSKTGERRWSRYSISQ